MTGILLVQGFGDSCEDTGMMVWRLPGIWVMIIAWMGSPPTRGISTTLILATSYFFLQIPTHPDTVRTAAAR